MMRKPRNIDAELKTLADKARQLKERRVRQLGELVIATGADALAAEMLAGALLDAAGTKDTATREGWRAAGAGFFQRMARKTAQGPARKPSSAPAHGGGDAPTRSPQGAN